MNLVTKEIRGHKEIFIYENSYSCKASSLIVNYVSENSNHDKSCSSLFRGEEEMRSFVGIITNHRRSLIGGGSLPTNLTY